MNSLEIRQRKNPGPINGQRRLLLTPPPSSRPVTRFSKHDIHGQAQCALLTRLPAEIRLMIWEAAIGGRNLHILRPGNKLSYRMCKPLCLVRRLYYYTCCCEDASRVEQSLLSLLKTCRRVYSEAVSILYKSNVFSFTHLGTINYLRSSILPSRWATIQSLQVYWKWRPIFHGHLGVLRSTWEVSPHSKATWDSACRAIKTLKGLRHFALVTCACEVGCRPEAVLDLLEPLKDLRLRQPWELNIGCLRGNHHAVCTTLKTAGFDCCVTNLNKHGLTEIHLDFTALDDQDVLESFDFDSFLSDDDDIYDFSVPV